MTKVLDVPYGDHFENREKWLVVSKSNRHRKCILRASNTVHFVKSTFFRSKIESRTNIDMVTYFNDWFKIAKERDHFVSKVKPAKQAEILADP